MSNESVCQVVRSWVDLSSFHERLFGVVYVTRGDFHDGSEKGKASVRQTLCQSWDMPTGSDERIRQAPCRSQICAQDPES
jgi:hypothetical protein